MIITMKTDSEIKEFVSKIYGTKSALILANSVIYIFLLALAITIAMTGGKLIVLPFILILLAALILNSTKILTKSYTSNLLKKLSAFICPKITVNDTLKSSSHSSVTKIKDDYAKYNIKNIKIGRNDFNASEIFATIYDKEKCELTHALLRRTEDCKFCIKLSEGSPEIKDNHLKETIEKAADEIWKINPNLVIQLELNGKTIKMKVDNVGFYSQKLTLFGGVKESDVTLSAIEFNHLINAAEILTDY